ncbi:hypothetical protein R3P38DRAFT_3205675 [Favolaschia claudopus]|uniref:Uncharacterized protein n=1 Tax=Favolaschia claudopus TaxID=2862362 RepID=A0AAW0ANC7_9AGAR
MPGLVKSCALDALYMLDMGTIQGLGLWIITGLVNDAKTVSLLSDPQIRVFLIPIVDVTLGARCSGAYFRWNVGPIFKTYPFIVHDTSSNHQPRYTLLSADFVTSIIHVQSIECAAFVSLPGSSCDACRTVDSAVAVVEKSAQQSFGKKSIDRLNHAQLEAKLSALSRQLKAEQIKKNNHWTSLKAARKREAAFTELFDLLSAHNVPGLPRLLSTAKNEGWGTQKTTQKSQLAIEGKYHARNYTEFDRDLAILMYELGGGATLYALNKAPVMLPSRFTIADERRTQNLRITVGDVKMIDILENIEILFRDAVVSETGPVLHTISQDEISGDGRLCYLEETDEIAGLCEHATSKLKTFQMGSDLTCIEEVVTAIRAGDIHVGKEYSVAAISRHAPTDYGAKPILILPTCKKGSWRSAAEILQKLVQAWKLSPHGEAKLGKLTGGRTRPGKCDVTCHTFRESPTPFPFAAAGHFTGADLFVGAGPIAGGGCFFVCIF